MTKNKIHNIVLLVDTAALSAAEFVQGESDPNDFCRFADQEKGTNVEKYSTTFTTGDRLIWTGLSADSASDTVEITRIQYEAGYRMMEGIELPEQARAKKAARVARGSKNQWEKYSIFFTINGNSENEYKIDPIGDWEPPH